MSEPRKNEGDNSSSLKPQAAKGEAGSTRLKQRLIVFALVVVTVACVAFIIGYLVNLSKTRRPVQMKHDSVGIYEYLHGQVFGSEGAMVEILAVLPMESGTCQGPTIKYLERLGQEYQNHLRVRFVNYLSDEGQKLVSKATLFFDGESAQQDPDGRNIQFTGAFQERYTIEDIRVILQAKLDAAYGEEAPKIPLTGVQRFYEIDVWH